MKVGITDTGYFLAPERIDTLGKAKLHEITPEFISQKIGFVSLARKSAAQKSSDLCVAAYQDLAARVDDAEALLANTEFLCVCTQNGDYILPQTSAIVQHKLGISHTCASFDISLGCSGYVYALHIAKCFMESNGFKKGLVFTSDPYSDIIDPRDKNTDLIFGDGAAVTLLTTSPVFDIGEGVFETHGDLHEQLIKREQQKLMMNGRGIFNFTMSTAPDHIRRCLAKNAVSIKDIDMFLLHQASKYLIDNLCRRMALSPEKVPFFAGSYGNTVSSSIPIGLKEFMDTDENKCMLLCGFGVGLSIASTVIRRR